jgi:nitrite reductase/ring-hydroxylating ferredoxin subunit
MPRIALIALARLRSCAMQRVELAGHAPLLVVARDGHYFVLDDTCSHGAAALSAGELVDYEILCPHHRGGFDIRSGAPTRPPCAAAIGCHAVSIDDGMLYIETD